MVLCAFGVPVTLYIMELWAVPLTLLYYQEAVATEGWKLMLSYVLAPLLVHIQSLVCAVLAKHLFLPGCVSLVHTPGEAKFAETCARLRHWIVDRILILSDFSLVTGTPLWPVVLRMLGARIGKRCLLAHMHVGSDVAFLDIGDDVWIGTRKHLASNIIIYMSLY